MRFAITESVKHLDTALELLQAGEPGKQLVVRVAIVHQNKLLILKRAAGEHFLPNMYEIPGGKAEPSVDGTMLDTAARELLEETGFHIRRIIQEFEGFEYRASKGMAKQYNF